MTIPYNTAYNMPAPQPMAPAAQYNAVKIDILHPELATPGSQPQQQMPQPASVNTYNYPEASIYGSNPAIPVAMPMPYPVAQPVIPAAIPAPAIPEAIPAAQPAAEPVEAVPAEQPAPAQA